MSEPEIQVPGKNIEKSRWFLPDIQTQISDAGESRSCQFPKACQPGCLQRRIGTPGDPGFPGNKPKGGPGMNLVI